MVKLIYIHLYSFIVDERGVFRGYDYGFMRCYVQLWEYTLHMTPNRLHNC